MKRIIILAMALLMCIVCITACQENDSIDNNNNKNVNTGRIITEAEIKDALGDYSGALSIEGSIDNITSFTYVISNVNSTNLSNKATMRKVVNYFLTDASKLTYGEYKSCVAFTDTLYLKLFMDPNEENLSMNTEIESVLSIICDGQRMQYDNWIIYATIDNEADTLTVYVTSK